MERWSSGRMRWVTEIVNGICPECSEETVLVSKKADICEYNILLE